MDATTSFRPTTPPSRDHRATIGSTGPLACLDEETLDRLARLGHHAELAGRATIHMDAYDPVAVIVEGELLVLRADLASGHWVDEDGTLRDEHGDRVAVDPVTGLRVVGRLLAGEVVGSTALAHLELAGTTLRACSTGATLVTFDPVEFHLELARTLLACRELARLEPGVDVDVRRMGLYNDLPMRDLAELLRDARVDSWHAGDAIVQQGELGDRFHVVLDGELVVVRDEVEVGRCTRGDHFGELALLRDAPRAATVLATGDARTWSVTRAAFDLLVRHRLGPAADATSRDLAAGRGPGGAWGSPLAARLRHASR